MIGPAITVTVRSPASHKGARRDSRYAEPMALFRGRCDKPLGEPCLCFRPGGHEGLCECSCVTYGTPHEAQPSPLRSSTDARALSRGLQFNDRPGRLPLSMESPTNERDAPSLHRSVEFLAQEGGGGRARDPQGKQWKPAGKVGRRG